MHPKSRKMDGFGQECFSHLPYIYNYIHIYIYIYIYIYNTMQYTQTQRIASCYTILPTAI